MNNKLETIFVLFLLFAMFFNGYVLRDLEGQYVADKDLTKKVQEQQERINGLEQLYKTANNGVCTRTIIYGRLEDRE